MCYESLPTAQAVSQALKKVRLSATAGNLEGIWLTATADAGKVVRLSATAVNDVLHDILLHLGYCFPFH